MKVIFPALDVRSNKRNRSLALSLLWKITALREQTDLGLDVYEVESYCSGVVQLTDMDLQLTEDPLAPFVGVFAEGVLNSVLDLCSDGESFRFHTNSCPQYLEDIVRHVGGSILNAEVHRDVWYPNGYQPQLSINF